MATIEFVTMLQQIDVFESIPTEILAKIAGAGKVEMRKVRKNTLICRKGDEANEMFILLAGEILFYDEIHGKVKELGKMTKNNDLQHKDLNRKHYPFFGETALYGSTTFQRTAFAKATIDSVVLVIPANVIDPMLEHSQKFINSIREQSKKNLARSAALKKQTAEKNMAVKTPNGKSTNGISSKNGGNKNKKLSPPLSSSKRKKFSQQHKNPSFDNLKEVESNNRESAVYVNYETSSALLNRHESHINVSRASSQLSHKAKRRYTRADVEFLMKKAFISHKFIAAHLDSIPWDPKDQSISEADLLQDSMLSPLFNDTLAIKDMAGFVTEVEKIFKAVMNEVHGGKNASYIPILASVDPSKFAISICTVSGQQWSYGDIDDTFSIQSSVKPYMYAKGIEENGIKKMRQHIGIEPSGLAFNAVTLNKNKRAHNPYGNAGAMTSASLIGLDLDTATRFKSFRNWLHDMAGEELIDFDMATYLCEWETAYRNNAILYTLTKAGAFPRGCTPREALDFYIQCCAIEVNVKSCAAMAATLAAGGECPLSKKRLMSPATVKYVLTLMYSCGMYDYSGTWSQHVGVPAKSGVAGVIQMVFPNIGGVAIWSPPLDSRGNSVRGIEVSKRLCRYFRMSIFEQSVVSMNGNIDRKNRSGGGGNMLDDNNRGNSAASKRHRRRKSIAKTKSLELNDVNLTPSSIASGRGSFDENDILTPTGDNRALPATFDNNNHSNTSSPMVKKDDSNLGTPSLLLDDSLNSSNGNALNAELKKFKARDLLFERLLLLADLVHAFREISGGKEGDDLGQLFVSKADIFAYLNTQGLGATNQIVPIVKGTLNRIASANDGKIHFKSIFIRGNRSGDNVIVKALLGNMVIRDFGLFSKHIKEIYQTVREEKDDGKLLKNLVHEFREAKLSQSGDEFGVALCTIDGQEIAEGEAFLDIPLMETVKPLLYALAMEDSGIEEVHKYVGIEPTSSDPTGFDLLQPTSHGDDDDHAPAQPTPYNPFTDSGGLTICSMIGKGHRPNEAFFEDKGTRFKHVLSSLRKLAGSRGRFGFANPIFLAQKERGLQVKAVSHYIKGMGCYPPSVDPDSSAEQYFEARAIKTSCASLAVCAATIANDGVCPLTNERCLKHEVVSNTIRQMYSSGMNAYAGEWQFNVGIPASCGSSGLMLLVIPKVCGICIYSPKINEYQVPYRGVRFSHLLTKKYRVNIFDQLVFGNNPNSLMTDMVDDENNNLGDGEQNSDGNARTLIDEGRCFSFLSAAAAGNIAILKSLIDTGIDINTADYDKRTALHLACSEGRLEATKFLLENGADPNAHDRWRGSPLDDAKRVGSYELTNLVESFIHPM